MQKRICALLSIIICLVSVVCFTSCTHKQGNLSSYDIDISISGKEVIGSETFNYYNDTETSIKELKFNLFGNAFRKEAIYPPINLSHTAKAYPYGINYGDMCIEKVSANKKDLTFEICGVDKNILLVQLESEIFPEERVSVDIVFRLNLAKVIARTGVNDKTINLANFYPQLCARDENGFYECVYYSTGDPFYSDIANYNVSITVDSSYIIASSGKLINQTEQNGLKTAKYSLSKARNFAFVLSKDFNILTSEVDGVEINYYYYNDLTPDKSMEYAEKSLSYFSNTFGEYVYNNYSIVQTPFVQGGMEYPALVMISDSLSPEEFGEVIVHETAHQWWQVAVGNNEIEYGFLDEGLSEYSVILFYENHSEYGLTRESLVKSALQTYKIYCSVYDKVFGKVNTSMVRSLTTFDSEYDYVNIAYIKPCIMYDNLRQTIGENRFFEGLKRYYKQYKYKNANPYDIVGVYEKIGADTNGFFTSFYDGKVIL